MSPRSFFLPLAAAGAVFLFLFALFQLLLLRYERGDVYPAYSTLRADPLGTRAFYEALASVPGYTTRRGFTILHGELDLRPQTLFYLGLEESELPTFSEDETAALDSYVKEGGRVVLALTPTKALTGFEQEEVDRKKKHHDEKKDMPPGKPSGKEKPVPPPPVPKPAPAVNEPPAGTEQERYERREHRDEEKDDTEGLVGDYHPTLGALWGFGIDRHTDDEGEKKTKKSDWPTDADDKEKPEVLAASASDSGLGTALPWKSASYFIRLDPAFEVLYRAKGKPVLARRDYGRGEVIIATDSYFVSNEALRDDRRPQLLALLAGPAGLLLFDETHLGTQTQEGVMALVEHFRLEGYLLGALAVLLLFLWHNSVPLVPPRASTLQAALGGAVSGKDSRSGLVNLLRRNISAREILRTSFTEWKRGITPARPHLQAKMTEMEAILAALPGDTAAGILPAYHQMREINQPGRAANSYGTKPGTAHPTAAVRPD
jgi:hypothetical protein